MYAFGPFSGALGARRRDDLGGGGAGEIGAVVAGETSTT